MIANDPNCSCHKTDSYDLSTLSTCLCLGAMITTAIVMPNPYKPISVVFAVILMFMSVPMLYSKPIFFVSPEYLAHKIINLCNTHDTETSVTVQHKINYYERVHKVSHVVMSRTLDDHNVNDNLDVTLTHIFDRLRSPSFLFVELSCSIVRDNTYTEQINQITSGLSSIYHAAQNTRQIYICHTNQDDIQITDSATPTLLEITNNKDNHPRIEDTCEYIIVNGCGWQTLYGMLLCLGLSLCARVAWWGQKGQIRLETRIGCDERCRIENNRILDTARTSLQPTDIIFRHPEGHKQKGQEYSSASSYTPWLHSEQTVIRMPPAAHIENSNHVCINENLSSAHSYVGKNENCGTS